tara:strand:- start:39718 stop:40038 length:321 start_codon:yes stop_codon:yes gene_type:complete
MTTPILLAEAVALELRNVMKSLEVGMPARLDDDEGYIDFVCDDYIVLCTHEMPDPNTLHGTRKVRVLVYPNDWDRLEIEADHFQNKRHYHRPVGDHPGNDMIPKKR